MGTTFGAGGGTNLLDSLNNRQEHENSPEIVTSMVHVFDYTYYALVNPGASLSFVTLLFLLILISFMSNLVNHLVFPRLLVNPF